MLPQMLSMPDDIFLLSLPPLSVETLETLKTPSCESLDLRAKLAHLSDLLSVEEEQDGGRDHGYAEECEE
jgi:hypothetical protein